FRDLCDRFSAELARLSLERVSRSDHCSRVLVAHGFLDLADRFRPVFLEMAQDTDKGRPKLGPAFFEMNPVDDVPSFVGHTQLLIIRVDPGGGPPTLSSG